MALNLLQQGFDLGLHALHAFWPAQNVRIFAAGASALTGQGRIAELHLW